MPKAAGRFLEKRQILIYQLVDGGAFFRLRNLNRFDVIGYRCAVVLWIAICRPFKARADCISGIGWDRRSISVKQQNRPRFHGRFY
jgi:hypothetical protein